MPLWLGTLCLLILGVLLDQCRSQIYVEQFPSFLLFEGIKYTLEEILYYYNGLLFCRRNIIVHPLIWLRYFCLSFSFFKSFFFHLLFYPTDFFLCKQPPHTHTHIHSHTTPPPPPHTHPKGGSRNKILSILLIKRERVRVGKQMERETKSEQREGEREG